MSANWDQEVRGVVKHEIDTKLLLKIVTVCVVGIVVLVLLVFGGI